MTEAIKARTIGGLKPIRLKDFDTNSDANLNTINTQVVSIDFQDNEATRRMVMHSAKRVIRQHKDEIEALAYK